LFNPKLVTVTADGGTVHLTGTVPTFKDRRTAEASPGECAGRVDSVTLLSARLPAIDVAMRPSVASIAVNAVS
jgi:osmotically-inducible protein OsmY